MKAYKGFNKDLTCRGFQYEQGKTYEMDTAVLCESGFHACEMPLDVLSYYTPNNSVFHEVELDGVCDDRIGDSKVCAKKITIGAEIGIPGLVKAQIEWVKNTIGYDAAIKRANGSPDKYATGDQGAASATGKDSVALAAGKDCKVMGGLGCAIFAVERGDWNGETYPIISVNSAIVDGTTIKPDTWYKLQNGEFVEVVDETD